MSIIEEIAAERARQIDVENWTPAHDDDEHASGQLARAACCYSWQASLDDEYRIKWQDRPAPSWPWDRKWWKSTTRRRDLIKAGALIVAEIERLDRAAPGHGEGGS